MPNPEDALHLHYSDLKLLMENYQNVIKLNTLLLEQQRQLLELQKDLAKNQNVISERQAKIRDKIHTMIDKVDNQYEKMTQTFPTIESSQIVHKNIEDALHGRFDSTIIKIDNAKSAVDSMNLDMTKQHSGVTNKLYVALVGSALIILALIGMVTSMADKYRILHNMHEALDKIMIFFKII